MLAETRWIERRGKIMIFPRKTWRNFQTAELRKAYFSIQAIVDIRRQRNGYPRS